MAAMLEARESGDGAWISEAQEALNAAEDEVDANAVGFNAPNSTETLANHLCSPYLPVSLERAEQLILEVVEELEAGDFWRRNPTFKADEYAVQRWGCGWYVKVNIEAGASLYVCSFHPPERPIRTVGGNVIKR
jgi:hypothetical protein